MKFVFPVMAIFAAALFLNACNTVQGAGQDIKAGGQAISNASNDVKQEMKK